MRERNRIADAISDIRSLEGDAADAAELWEMANSEGDEAMLADVESLLRSALDRASQAEFKALLSGELDANNCYVEIHAGEGGTESQDWASMLRRMYVRWANRRGFKVEEVDEHSGEEAGIKSATLQITGDSAYGWLKGETGTHRLVRISPFDSNARRHTSFAAVSVYPVIDDTIQVEIEEKDVRVDTYRASGAGGQHINKTDSAVRLTHGPTGIVVSCQNDRSQHKNRAAAWDMLRARLYEMELKKREDAAQAEHDAKGKIGFGNSIRSYVLQPYQMVKDQRTAMETSDTQGVLDGDIDAFLAAALSEKIRSEE